jgi:hypothetical protein
MPVTKATINFKDHSKKNGSASLNFPDLTVLDGASLLAMRLAFEVACKTISTGSHQTSVLSDTNVADTQGTGATNQDSINKNKMVFKYKDDTDPTIKGSMSVPAADNQWEIAGTNDVDTSAIPVAAMIDFINASAVSKIGNPVTVYEVVMG